NAGLLYLNRDRKEAGGSRCRSCYDGWSRRRPPSIFAEFSVEQSAAGMEQHLCTALGPPHMLLLLHPPVHQLVHCGLNTSRGDGISFTVFLPVVNQSGLVGCEVRAQLVHARANLLKARCPPRILLGKHGVDINPVVKACQRDVGTVYRCHAKPSTSPGSNAPSDGPASIRSPQGEEDRGDFSRWPRIAARCDTNPRCAPHWR